MQGPPRSRAPSRASLSPLVSSPGLPQEEINKNEEINLQQMSVAELKQILSNHGVDYRTCLEKQELVEKVQQYCGHGKSLLSN